MSSAVIGLKDGDIVFISADVRVECMLAALSIGCDSVVTIPINEIPTQKHGLKIKLEVGEDG